MRLLLPLFCILFLTIGCTEVKREYYRNGQIKSVTHYRFGKETGTTVHHHENLPVRILEVEMRKGKKHGKYITRYFNNNIEVSAFYKNDVIDGIEMHYYLSGNRSKEIHYTKGKKNGPSISWHSNGLIKESGAFVNDLYDGIWENYDERGMLVGEGTFDKGTGKRTIYDEFGRIQMETNYVNNKKDGLETHFLPSGEIDKTYLFKEDRVIEVNGVLVENM